MIIGDHRWFAISQPIMPCSNTTQPLGGTIRHNSAANCYEVYTGSNWASISNPYISPSPEMQEILEWAQKKMQLEAELDKLCAEYPTLAAARQQVEDAKKQLEVVKLLVKDYN